MRFWPKLSWKALQPNFWPYSDFPKALHGNWERLYKKNSQSFRMWKQRHLHPKVCKFRRLNLPFLHSKRFTGLWCSLYLAFDWPVAACHCNCVRKIGLPVVYDWQVVVNSSSSQCIHSVNSQLFALSLVLAYDIIISVVVKKH